MGIIPSWMSNCGLMFICSLKFLSLASCLLTDIVVLSFRFTMRTFTTPTKGGGEDDGL